MDIRGIANSAIITINPNIPMVFLKSTGYTIGAGRKQEPSYATPLNIFGQMQALDNKDLKQLDGLNIQGTVRALYINQTAEGVVRPTQTGGDLVQISGQTWLVVKVLESWSTFTKVAICLQQA